MVSDDIAPCDLVMVGMRKACSVTKIVKQFYGWPTINEKADSTLRSSQAVPHPSTSRALCCLTSEVERDPVHSTRYGRRRTMMRVWAGDWRARASCLRNDAEAKLNPHRLVVTIRSVGMTIQRRYLLWMYHCIRETFQSYSQAIFCLRKYTSTRTKLRRRELNPGLLRDRQKY